jgi:hypothetical protein
VKLGRVAATFATFVLAALACGGCKKRRPPTEVEAPVAPSVELPVDRALPGELAEGSEKAFGLTLPRVMVVRGRFDDIVYGDAEVTPDKVANYIRARVSAAKVETGPAKTVFPRVTVRGQPDVELAIQVLSHGGSTELQIRNLSLVKMTPGLSEEQRWRAAGLKPDGTPLDPTHLE